MASMKRKTFTGDEKLDPKTMTMCDLITWNPNNNTGLILPGHEGKKSNRGRKLTKNRPTQAKSASKSPTRSGKPPAVPATATVAAPQVKMSANGSMVLDEESLTIRPQTQVDDLEYVEEGRQPRKISCLSFRNRVWRKGTAWSEMETDLFYMILSSTGTDFTLMHDFFPSRARAELKNKFNREERVNPKRLNDALRMPATLNDALYQRAREVVQILEEEKEQKKKQKEREKRERDEKQWNEEDVDLEAEAASEIRRLQMADEASGMKKRGKGAGDLVACILDASQKAAMESINRKRRKRMHDDGNKWKPYLIENLGEDFPAFEVVETNAGDVSIEANPDGPPIVRVPHKTRLQVLPADEDQPIRVLFECPSVARDRPMKQFLIQHQMHANEPSTGFLHLFGSAE